MSDKKQSDVKHPGWLRKACLWSARIVSGLLVIAISYCICSPYLSPERRAANNDHTHLGWYLIGLAVTGGVVLCIPRFITSSPGKDFITRVLTTGITGGTFALLLPIAVKSTTTGVGGLRHSILLATGGLLAILTLGETRRKNDIDKRKNEQEKEKNDKDHRRQVRAERRERYTKAVEQLGDEKAPIRMGGVYTLVSLIDEWLEDESIDKYEDRLKEGQVIINNLCAYIRSPFTLASHYDELFKDIPTGSYKDKEQDFYIDKAKLDSEADIRLSIIKEIHNRLQGTEEIPWGTWSDFEYDFSGSTFFYPVNLTKSYYKKPVNFGGSTYRSLAYFFHSTYRSLAYFVNSTYHKSAHFGGSTHQSWAEFSYSTYQGGADFSYSTYQEGADFRVSTYQGRADFTGSTYQGRADFRNSTYQDLADFTDSTYQDLANFRSSTYQNKVYFNDSTYQSEADFSGSIFYQKIYFGEDGDINSFSRFTDCTPQFYDETNHKNTLFGSPTNDFTAENSRGYPIYLNLEGLPLGCKFLAPEQKEYLEDKFQEIEKINDELFEVKDLKEKEELSKKLQALNKELHKWREEVTTV